MEYMEKKFFYCYKITNKTNGKYYYGVHETYNLDDGYMGSGTAIKKAIVEEGLDNFKKEIVKFFNNRDEMYEFERQIVSKEMLKDENSYNLSIGGRGGSFYPFGLTAVIDKDGNRFMCSTKDEKFLTHEYVSLHKGMIVCKNQLGEFETVSVNDERYKNGDLKPFCYGMVAVKDSCDNHYYINNDDERIKNGTFTPINKGKFVSKDLNGKTYFIDSCDERYRNGLLVGLMSGKTIVKNGEMNKTIGVDEFNKGGYTHINKNKVLVKDKHGDFFLVNKNDERYLKGELIHASIGRKVVTNGLETKQVDTGITMDGYHGVNKGKQAVKDVNGRVFMCETSDDRIKNGELVSVNKGKFLCVDSSGAVHYTTKDDERYKSGELVAYSKGRKYGVEHSNKLREARGKRVTINDGKNLKYIHPEELDEYLNNGWVKGRLPFKHKTKTCYINNGTILKRVRETDLINFLNNGWVRGGLHKIPNAPQKSILEDLLKNSKTITDVAKKLNTTRKTIVYWCRCYGIDTNIKD